MLLFTIIRVAFGSLVANKLRSVLTMLGVIIGVAAVIAMLGLGAGTEEKITESVRKMGANLLIIRAGWRGGQGVVSGTQQNLKTSDAEALLLEVPDVNMVSPEVSGNAQVKYMSNNKSYSVNGYTATYFPVRNVEIENGRALTDMDVDRAARVAVIGSKVSEELFLGADPIGEMIKLKGINFTVIGVTKAKGEGWGSPDDQVAIPLTTAMSQVHGRDFLGSIACQIRAGADLDAAQEEITQVMRRQHRIQADRPDDFMIWNLQEMRDQMEKMSSIFTMLLAGVASVSLLVGGIGIMNIMLVTVTERTREIGIRKSLGARNSDLMTQFLLEAVVVSVTGGVIGILIGVGTIYGFNEIITRMEKDFFAKVEMWPIVLSFCFSVLVGIFFGWYPARKAASLDPIEALRYE